MCVSQLLCVDVYTFGCVLQLYSWGSGDGGRLGHGDCQSHDSPTPVAALAGKHVTAASCGSTYR